MGTNGDLERDLELGQDEAADVKGGGIDATVSHGSMSATLNTGGASVKSGSTTANVGVGTGGVSTSGGRAGARWDVKASTQKPRKPRTKKR